MCVLYIFWRSNAYLRSHLQICFPIQLVPFHFNAVLFSWAEAFYFDEVPFIISFMSFAVGDILVKILLSGISEIFLHMFFSRTYGVMTYMYVFYPS